MTRIVTSRNRPKEPSHLFLVRMWLEEREEGEKQWCGKIQHVVYGEPQYFQSWGSLIANIESMLQAALVGTEDGDAPQER